MGQQLFWGLLLGFGFWVLFYLAGKALDCVSNFVTLRMVEITEERLRRREREDADGV